MSKRPPIRLCINFSFTEDPLSYEVLNNVPQEFRNKVIRMIFSAYAQGRLPTIPEVDLLLQSTGQSQVEGQESGKRRRGRPRKQQTAPSTTVQNAIQFSPVIEVEPTPPPSPAVSIPIQQITQPLVQQGYSLAEDPSEESDRMFLLEPVDDDTQKTDPDEDKFNSLFGERGRS